MKIKQVISTLNEMQADGVVERYAIGGAVGATFYVEPVATLGVDVFVSFRVLAGSALISPQPIFDYLKARGFCAEGEHIVIAGWPVQFLPPTGKLVEEALREAVTSDVDGSPAVFSPLNTWQQSHCRPAEPRTRRACSNSSRRAHWRSSVLNKSCPGTNCWPNGSDLRNNSLAIHDV